MSEPEIYHVTPVDDLRKHDQSADCWCKPVQDEECPNVWIHNAMDQRDLYETGERLLA